MLKDKKGVELELTHINKNEKKRIIDLVAREIMVNVFVNRENITTLSCSPGNLKYLTAGFLYSLGIIKNRQDIISIKIGKKSVYFEINQSLFTNAFRNRVSSPSQISKLILKTQKFTNDKNRIRIKNDVIYTLLSAMQEKAGFFKLSGGVHSCGLADPGGQMVLFCEDISRYNTIDRILGEALLKGIDTENKVILTTCRITAGIMQKIIIGRVPVVISRSAVTDYAIKLAERFSVTLIGFTRGERMNVYNLPERIEN